MGGRLDDGRLLAVELSLGCGVHGLGHGVKSANSVGVPVEQYDSGTAGTHSDISCYPHGGTKPDLEEPNRQSSGPGQ